MYFMCIYQLWLGEWKSEGLENLFVWFREKKKKNERIENVVYIDLLSSPY